MIHRRQFLDEDQVLRESCQFTSGETTDKQEKITRALARNVINGIV